MLPCNILDALSSSIGSNQPGAIDGGLMFDRPIEDVCSGI
jgi:hypothetical protein